MAVGWVAERPAANNFHVEKMNFKTAFILSAFFAIWLSFSSTAEPVGEPNWISLFNGSNLDGWVRMNGGTFTATNGILHLEGGKGWLRTEKEYGDFILEAEWRGLETNYNSGIFLRAPLDGNPWATNIWQVNTKQSAIGQLLQGSDEIVKPVTPPVPADEWVKFRIEARGTNLLLVVDGKYAWEFHELKPARGFIGLQAEGKSFDFRNLRIRETAAQTKQIPAVSSLQK
jgi:hypothetical protein